MMPSSSSAATTTTADDSRLPPPSLPPPSTFFCHECESTVSLPSASPPLICPRCHGDFLEESSPPVETPIINPNHSLPHRPRLRRLRYLQNLRTLAPLDDLPGNSAAELSDDEYSQLLGLPSLPPTHAPNRNYHDVFDRLIRHIDAAAADLGSLGGPSPAPKASIDAIPTVEISSSFLASDPGILCAVCKDEFLVGSEAKRLPCNHIYHGDCIIPWLNQHNSCPVCRFQLPTDRDDQERRRQRRVVGAGSFGDFLMEDGVDFLDMGGMLAQIARRNRTTYPSRSATVAAGMSGVSPTQMAQAEAGSVGPANSMETVSSVWHRDGSSSVAGAGVGERAEEETDVVVSMDRRGLLE